MDKDFFIVEHALKVPYCHVTLLISTATPHVHNLSSFVMPRNRFVVFVSCKRREKPRHFSVGSGDQEVIKTNLDKIAWFVWPLGGVWVVADIFYFINPLSRFIFPLLSLCLSLFLLKNVWARTAVILPYYECVPSDPVATIFYYLILHFPSLCISLFLSSLFLSFFFLYFKVTIFTEALFILKNQETRKPCQRVCRSFLLPNPPLLSSVDLPFFCRSARLFVFSYWICLLVCL